MKDYSQVFLKQKTFFQTQATKSYEFRIDQLKKLKTAIKKHESQILDALKNDLNKSEFEAFASEIGPCYKEISNVISQLKDWMKPKKVTTSLVNFPSTARIIPEPYGNILIVSPWNYPFLLAIKPIIGAICAGNTVFLKSSELSVEASKVLMLIISSTFSEEFIFCDDCAVEGTTEILKLPFDYLFFTGSPQVGKVMMRAAAENLTPVTLELGGKSPCIIDYDCDLKTAAKRVIWGKFFNAGQTCIAPDYLYVHENIYEQFLKLLKSTITEFYSQNPKQSEDYGRIINTAHHERLSNLINPDKVFHGGETELENLYIAPTLMKDITWEDEVMRSEIFGPILPILKFNDIADVIENINARPKPLAFYTFTNSSLLVDKLVNECSYGGGCVNDTLVHLAEEELSFGGVGASGMGQYHGHHSFETFSHLKSMLMKENWYDNPIRYAPFKGKIKFLRLLFR